MAVKTVITTRNYMPMMWKVVKTCGRFGLDEDEIRSAAGEAYTLAKKNYDKEVSDAWPSYLFMCMKNILIKESYRKRGYGMKQGFNIKIRPSSFRTGGTDGDDSANHARTMPEPHVSPRMEETVACSQLVAMLEKKLGPRNARVYILRTAYELTMGEIATLTGISRQRVHQILEQVEPEVDRLRRRLTE